MGQKSNSFEKSVTVDFRATSLHGDEIGIYEHERHQAKTRSFTKDFEIFGEVNDGDTKGFFGYRKDAWEPPLEKDSINYYTRKRLVIRWFNKGEGNNISMVGSLEEMTADSLRKTMIADDPLHSFKIVLEDYSYLVSLTKEHARLPGRIGEMWGFTLATDEDESKWEVFLLDERRFTIGTDFDVKKDEMKDVLVHIDERVLNLGKKVVITFYNRRLYECKQFYRTILLFTMMFKFKKELREKIQKGRELLEKYPLPFEIDGQEAAFMRNPRAIKR